MQTYKMLLTEQRIEMLNEVVYQDYDNIVVSVSGGKDSAVLMQYAYDNFPHEKIVCVHAVIDIDWKETLPVVKEQCKFFGFPLVEVQAVDAEGKDLGFTRILTRGRRDRATGEMKDQKFPDMGNRWCTSSMKVGPIHKFVRTLKGRTLILIGERAEESSQRAKLEAVRFEEKLSVNGRMVWNYSPLLEMTEKQVWEVINANDIPTHPCYSWGVSRASCAICIFSSNKEIALAAKHAPEIVAKYVEAERQIEHTFRYKPSTKRRAEEKITVEMILREQGAWSQVEGMIA